MNTPQFHGFSSEKIDAEILRVIREQNIKSNELDERQIAEVMKQAFACGDITRLVLAATPPRQQVVYHPYAESERLKSRIAKLEAALQHIATVGRAQCQAQCAKDYIPRGRHAPECPNEFYLTAEESLGIELPE